MSTEPAIPGCLIEPLSPFGMLVRPIDGACPMLPVSQAQIVLLLRNRLLVFRGFETFSDQAATAAYASLWGPLLEWDFGAVFEVIEQESPRNYLFTSGSVPYHWDGAFAKQVPWLQVFQCVESPGANQGGETLFCDTHRVWQTAEPSRKELWQRIEVEYATEKVAHYGGRIRSKLVATHPRTGESVLRFNEPANATTARLNTPEVIPHGLPDDNIPAFLADLIPRIYDPAAVYSHAWQPGDRVIADNFVLLHGRKPYGSQLPRRLWRVHVL
jgi:alpha-ketoglutarate-dependent taurine dioxygenase